MSDSRTILAIDPSDQPGRFTMQLSDGTSAIVADPIDSPEGIRLEIRNADESLTGDGPILTDEMRARLTALGVEHIPTHMPVITLAADEPAAPAAPAAAPTEPAADLAPASIIPPGHTPLDVPVDVMAALPEGTQVSHGEEGEITASVPFEGRVHHIIAGIGAELHELLAKVESYFKSL